MVTQWACDLPRDPADQAQDVLFVRAAAAVLASIAGGAAPRSWAWHTSHVTAKAIARARACARCPRTRSVFDRLSRVCPLREGSAVDVLVRVAGPRNDGGMGAECGADTAAMGSWRDGFAGYATRGVRGAEPRRAGLGLHPRKQNGRPRRALPASMGRPSAVGDTGIEPVTFPV